MKLESNQKSNFSGNAPPSDQNYACCKGGNFFCGSPILLRGCVGAHIPARPT